MAPPTGDPRQSPKPQPIGNIPFIFLFTTCALCIVFILWRRASTLRKVVAHQLNIWTQKQGTIRLSGDDGPPALEFLSNEYDEDHQRVTDDQPLAITTERLRATSVGEAAVPVGPEEESTEAIELPDGLSPVPPPQK